MHFYFLFLQCLIVFFNHFECLLTLGHTRHCEHMLIMSLNNLCAKLQILEVEVRVNIVALRDMLFFVSWYIHLSVSLETATYGLHQWVPVYGSLKCRTDHYICFQGFLLQRCQGLTESLHQKISCVIQKTELCL